MLGGPALFNGLPSLFTVQWGATGNTTKHVKLTETRLRAVLKGCGVARIGDLNAARAADWLAQQRDGGMSAATSNYYLQAVAGFARWLVKHRRMADNPLAPLTPINTKTDRRHDRGVLNADEFAALIRATRPAPTFRGLSGAIGRSSTPSRPTPACGPRNWPA
jgi:site-specific recombinase XerD